MHFDKFSIYFWISNRSGHTEKNYRFVCVTSPGITSNHALRFLPGGWIGWLPSGEMIHTSMRPKSNQCVCFLSLNKIYIISSVLVVLCNYLIYKNQALNTCVCHVGFPAGWKVTDRVVAKWRDDTYLDETKIKSICLLHFILQN